jgi:DNA-binding NarL/FixJ family response regulator
MPDMKLLQGLRKQIALQDEVEVVGEPRGTRQTLRSVRQLQPNVLLLDATSSSRDSKRRDSALLAAVHRTNPNTKIILLLDACTERSIAWALEQGARGCISIAAFQEGCLRAIRAVSRGEVWIGRKELAYVLDDLLSRLARAEKGADKSAAVLSQRELEIADAVRLGLTNKEIARKMRISPTTVKTHMEHIFHKLHLSHRVQLAILTPHRPPDHSSATFKTLHRLVANV